MFLEVLESNRNLPSLFGVPMYTTGAAQSESGDGQFRFHLLPQAHEKLRNVMAARGARSLSEALSIAIFDAAMIAELVDQGAQILAEFPPTKSSQARRLRLNFPPPRQP